MLKEIAETLGLTYNEDDFYSIQHLRRIQSQLPSSITPGDPDWGTQCEAAEKIAQDASNKVIQASVEQLLDASSPKVRVYKIKRTLKGERIKIKSATGKRYSFGPVWIESVKAGKGIAVNPNNREKLEMHAQHVGLSNFAEMDSKSLAAAIAALL